MSDLEEHRASERLRTIFDEELGGDVQQLKEWYCDEQWGPIRDLAHKYKVRLRYLGHEEAFQCCVRLESLYPGNDEAFRATAAELIRDLDALLLN